MQSQKKSVGTLQKWQRPRAGSPVAAQLTTARGCLDRFIYSLERLTAFHKPLVDALRGPLLAILPQVTGMLQSLVLEILQRRAAKLGNLMTDVKSVLPALLGSHNHALQNNALRLVKALMPAEPDDAAGESADAAVLLLRSDTASVLSGEITAKVPYTVYAG